MGVRGTGIISLASGMRHSRCFPGYGVSRTHTHPVVTRVSPQMHLRMFYKSIVERQ